MSKGKKKNVQTKKENPSVNVQKQKVTPAKRQAKKDAVLGAEKKGRLPLIAAIVCAVLILGAGIYLAGNDRSQNALVADSFTSENNASHVRLPASLFDDGKARHFLHVAGEFN
ncbi:MAG: hypothetical protein PVH28_03450, partial [Desulfobacterales bacterium]